MNRPVASEAGLRTGVFGKEMAGAAADRARRFRETALPHLDGVYTLARYLLGNASDAEDAVQECSLRAFRHFDTFRGGAIKPWLLAILRNVCHAEYARRAGTVVGFGEFGEPLAAEQLVLAARLRGVGLALGPARPRQGVLAAPHLRRLPQPLIAGHPLAVMEAPEGKRIVGEAPHGIRRGFT